MDSVFQLIIVVSACLASGLVSFKDLVANKTLKLFSNEQILKRIIIEANGAYWNNKEYEAKGHTPFAFKLIMIFVLMTFIIGILIAVIWLLLSVIVLLFSMLIITCENRKLFSAKIDNDKKVESKCL